MSSGSSRVLVVGASGLLGGMVARALLERKGPAVRILVREATRAKVSSLIEAGAEPIAGDLKDVSSLTAICAGVDTVVSTATAVLSDQPGDSIESVDRNGQLGLIDAAEAAGVKRFVYVSFPEQQEDFPLQSAKRAVEAKLQQAKLQHTILQPTCFQDVWLSPALGFDYTEGRVRVFGDGTSAMRWISAADVCDAIVRCALEGVASGQVVELVGPEALSGREVVRVFEEVAGRPLAAEFVPEEFLAAQQSEASDPRQQSFFALARQNARGYAPSPSSTAVEYFKPVRTVRQYAERVLGSTVQ